MKSKEELNALKEEVETPNKNLAELSEDELKDVAGGAVVVDWQEMFDGHMIIKLNASGRRYFVLNEETYVSHGKTIWLSGLEYDLDSSEPDRPFVVSYDPYLLNQWYQQYGALD